MNILKQMIKEFWFPFLVSIIWAIYATLTSIETNTFKVFITALGPTFFLISWLIGQYFRVKKQVSTEQNFVKIEDKFKQLFIDIENQNKETIAFITGGDSFVYFMIERNMKLAIALHCGKYPLYDVSARFVDLDCMQHSENHGMLGACEINIKLGTLFPESSILNQNTAPLDAMSYNIFIHARNGFFTQLLRQKEENGKFMFATRVQNNKDGTIIFEKIDNDFGEINWEDGKQ